MLEHQKYELLRAELKKARLEANLLQADLAVKLRKPQSYISKIESGERNIDAIEYISYCKAIGINPITQLKKIIDKFER